MKGSVSNLKQTLKRSEKMQHKKNRSSESRNVTVIVNVTVVNDRLVQFITCVGIEVGILHV